MQNDVKHSEAVMMGHDVNVKRHNLLHQNPKLADVLSPRRGRGVRQREDKAHQKHGISLDTDGGPLFPSKFPGTNQKLWPNRVSVGAEELVKHMSNVPGYLQRIEKADNLQEKALNFGVLDWHRLEKWTDNHPRVSVNENAADSSASSHASSSFSAFGSSSQSCRSSASSCLPQRKQSVSVKHYQHCSAENDHIQPEEGSSLSNDIGCNFPQSTPRKCPVKNRISISTEQRQHVVNLSAMCENKRMDLNSKDVSDSVRSFLGANTLQSRSKNCEISNSVNEKAKPHESKSDHREMSRELEHVGRSTSVCTVVDCPQDHHPGIVQLNGPMLECFQEIPWGNRLSFESRMNCVMPTESGRASFVGSFPSEGFHLSLDIPHSCPLPMDIHRTELSDINASGCDHSERSVLHDLLKYQQCSNEVPTLRAHGWHEKRDSYSCKLQKSTVRTPESLHRSGTKKITRGSELLPNIQSDATLIRSSSLRVGSGTQQTKWTSSTSQIEEREVASSKSRRSPLRRLLDPLLNPKAFNRGHPAGLMAGSPRQSSHDSKLPTQEELVSNCGPKSSSHMTTNSFGGNAAKGLTPSHCMPVENLSSVYDEKLEASTKQALLQLSWKNGVPLFTFSVNESDILAATRRKGTSSKEDFECIYTFYYVCEIKKKIGGWINQGNKGKRKELFSNIVGQMNVSCLKCPKNHFAVREFVLFGPELRPTAQEALDPFPNSELAAIVLRVPEEDTENFIGNLAHSNNCVDISKTKTNLETNKHVCSQMTNLENEQIPEKPVPKMVAILPSEVHGLSDTGKPATLVERWKSGGSCDCGGWDVGCSLSILTNNLQHSRSGVGQSCHSMDGTHRVELFIQGAGKGRRPVFSLMAFKEGLYTVDFHSSIAVLQAFAVCVAILHGGRPRDLHEVQDSRLESCVMKNPVGERGDAILVPHHPPLSPVGRA